MINILYKLFQAIKEFVLTRLNTDSDITKENWYNNPTETNYQGFKGAYGSLSGIMDESLDYKDQATWCYPVDNKRVVSKWGYRKIPGMKRHFHYGADFTSKGNKWSYAPTKCMVKTIVLPDKKYPYKWRWTKKDGWIRKKNIPKGRAWTPYVELISIADPSIRFFYRHCKPLSWIDVDGIVEAGEDIIELGNYGNSQGKHLHFEVEVIGKKVDPIKFLNKKIKEELNDGCY